MKSLFKGSLISLFLAGAIVSHANVVLADDQSAIKEKHWIIQNYCLGERHFTYDRPWEYPSCNGDGTDFLKTCALKGFKEACILRGGQSYRVVSSDVSYAVAPYVVRFEKWQNASGAVPAGSTMAVYDRPVWDSQHQGRVVGICYQEKETKFFSRRINF